MPDSILKSVREFFEGNPSVRKVAEDPAITAELLLLFRIILADGTISDPEMAALQRVCREAFGIRDEDMDEVIEYLQDFGYETTGRQAIDIFLDMDRERRVTLMKHLIEMARADRELNQQEVKLVKRVAAMLELSPPAG